MGTDPESDPHRDKRLVLHADVSVWVPETLQTSCDLRVFVKDPAEAIAPQDTRAGVRWHGRQRPKRCCLTQCAVRPVAVEVFLVLEQDVPGVGTVHDQHLVQQPDNRSGGRRDPGPGS